MALLLSPRLWIAAGSAVFLIAFAAFFHQAGGASARAEFDAYKLAQAEIVRQRQRAADLAAGSHEAFKAKEEVRYVTLNKTVDRIVRQPVYRNVCLPADGLRAANDAITGAAGEPEAAVPGSPAPR